MGLFLNYFDVSPVADTLTETQADIYIDDIEAQAIFEAPCLVEAGFPHTAAVKGIVRQAVLRWHRAGEGGVASEQQVAGPWSHNQSFDNRVHGEGRLYPGEVNRLRSLCRQWKATTGGRKAFSVIPK